MNEIIISRAPDSIDYLNNYSAIINVADTPEYLFCNPPVPYYWFPINELSYWSVTPFIAAARVVDKYIDKEKPILIHCHAGACRSPGVAYAIAASYIESNRHITVRWGRREDPAESYKQLEKHFKTLCSRGQVKPWFITVLKERFEVPDTYSIVSLMQTTKLTQEELAPYYVEKFKQLVVQ